MTSVRAFISSNLARWLFTRLKVRKISAILKYLCHKFNHNSGKEVLHLEDGEFFGEAALLFDHKRRMGTMVAIETSELYILNRKDFDMLVLPHPELVKSLEVAAINRVNNMLSIEERARAEPRRADSLRWREREALFII